MSATTDAGARLEIPIRLDAGDGAAVVGRRFEPDPEQASRWPAPAWIFAAHGAGASWHYFDVHVPGREDEEYSFASYMNRRGVGVVALDRLSMGDSPYPFDPEMVTLELMAEASDQAARAVREQLVSEVGASLLLCGLGHSGGGGVTIVQQALHRSFDLVAILGMPADDFWITGGQDALRAAISFDERGYFRMESMSRESRDASYGPDVPDDVVAAFHEGLLTPPSHMTMMAPGTLAAYARAIETPVLIGLGEVDLAGSPLDEPGRYSGSQDVTLVIQPGCRHVHWAGERRAELWSAIANWLWARARYGTGGSSVGRS